MTRLLVHVEGETEEVFVNKVLASHLYCCGYSRVSARLVGNVRQRERRGGIRPWATVRRDIVNHLRDDQESVATTLVDYYGLPQRGSGAWPGRSEASRRVFPEKAGSVERALLADVRRHMDNNFDPRRFIPYVMMHEFEAMLFSDCERFSASIGRPDLAPRFQAIRRSFNSPEEIDDSSINAPSKRIEALIGGYQKPLLGTIAVLEIGMRRIRKECPHFSAWLDTLENLSRARRDGSA